MGQPHEIEPELRAATPRRVTLQNQQYLVVFRILRFVAVLPIIFGLFLLSICVPAAFVNYFGTTITGQVSNAQESSNSSSCEISYEIDVNGKPRFGLASMDGSMCSGLQPGSSIPVRIFTPYPGLAAVPVGTSLQPEWETASAVIALAVLFSAFGWGLPAIAKKFVVEGIPVVGSIIDKKLTASGDSASCSLVYTFQSENPSAVVRKGSMVVYQAQWESVRVGDCMTVLYLPKKPHYTTLYAFSPYRAVE